MSLGNTMQKLSWQARLFFAFACMLIYGSILFFFSYFFSFLAQDLLSILFQAVIVGVFFGIGFPYIIQNNNKQAGNSFKRKIYPQLEIDETIEFQGAANLILKKEALGGRLFLTSEKLIFKSHQFNIQKKQVAIHLKDINRVQLRKTRSITNNGLRIQTPTETFDLILDEKEKWLCLLRAKAAI